MGVDNSDNFSFREIGENSSIHGVRQLSLTYHHSKFILIGWICIICVGFVTICYQITTLASLILTYPSSVAISVSLEHTIFPTVTACNMGVYKKSVVENIDTFVEMSQTLSNVSSLQRSKREAFDDVQFISVKDLVISRHKRQTPSNCSTSCTVSGDFCYISYNTANFNDVAQSTCAAVGGKLPFFSTKAQYDSYYAYQQTDLYNARFWLGFWNYSPHNKTNPGSWQDTNGTGSVLSFSNWCANEPSDGGNSNIRENCVTNPWNQVPAGCWIDVDCSHATQSNAFICMCQCPTLSIANGMVVISSPVPTINYTAAIQCDNGYWLVGGTTLTCINTGGGMSWDQPTPSCVYNTTTITTPTTTTSTTTTPTTTTSTTTTPTTTTSTTTTPTTTTSTTTTPTTTTPTTTTSTTTNPTTTTSTTTYPTTTTSTTTTPTTTTSTNATSTTTTSTTTTPTTTTSTTTTPTTTTSTTTTPTTTTSTTTTPTTTTSTTTTPTTTTSTTTTPTTTTSTTTTHTTTTSTTTTPTTTTSTTDTSTTATTAVTTTAVTSTIAATPTTVKTVSVEVASLIQNVSTAEFTASLDVTTTNGTADNIAAATQLNTAMEVVLSSLPQAELKQLGFQRNEFVTACLFSGIPCNNDEKLTLVQIPEFMNCYAFNHRDQTNLYTFERPGEKFGLSMAFNIQADEYINTVPIAGVQLFLQEQFDPILPGSMGSIYSPGLLYYIIISKRIETQLSVPSRLCLSSTKEYSFNLFKNDTYFTESCLRSYLQVKIIGKCGCGSAKYPLPNDNSQFCNLTSAKCATNYLTSYGQKLTEEAQLACPPACRSVSFDLTTTFASLSPEQSLLDHMNVTRTTYMNNVVMVKLFFTTGTIMVYTEALNFDVMSVLSNIGGSVGCIAGISMISLVELFFVIAKLVKLVKYKCHNRQLQFSNVSEFK